MGLISRVKDLLGIGGDGHRRTNGETTVAVEREGRREPEAESERAVKESPPEPEPTDDDAEIELVDSIKGIGPAYAERLGDAGVETVGELAAVDPGDLAEETGISEKRIEDWVARAKAR